MLISKTELIAVIDCDLQHDEKKLLEMVNKFQVQQNLDLVIEVDILNTENPKMDLTNSESWEVILQFYSQKNFLNPNNRSHEWFFMVKKKAYFK